MRLIRIVVPLVVALLASTLPAAALGGGTAARWPAAARVHGAAVHGDLGPAAAPQVALARVDHLLGIDAADFAFGWQRTSPIGTHLRGTQVVDGVPIDGTYAAVHVLGGRVRIVQARGSDAVGTPVVEPITATAAERAAARAVGVDLTGAPAGPVHLDSDRVLVPTRGQLVDTWRVGVIAPGVAATVAVAADDGRVLDVADERRFADAPPVARLDATATLFNPNPIATSGHTDLAQDVDVAGVDVDVATDPRVDAELVDLPIREFDEARAAAGNLVGPWVDVIAAGPMVPVAGRLAVTKTDPRFEGLMAYHHVDAIQRYVRDVLGMTDVNAEPQTVIALPVMGFDNSFYQPANDLILLGAGGVDDGEDAEVIIHELGHAIHDDQVPGWGRSFEGGAMGEGFGDLLAAAYFARVEGTVRSQDTCVMEWDATSYASGPQTCLRRTDTDKSYDDLDGSVHSSGEIWSRFLWEVRGQMGTTESERSDTLLRLLLTAHFLMTPDADFGEAVAAMLTTARAEGVAPDAETGEAWAQIITDRATALGIPLS